MSEREASDAVPGWTPSGGLGPDPHLPEAPTEPAAGPGGEGPASVPGETPATPVELPGFMPLESASGAPGTAPPADQAQWEQTSGWVPPEGQAPAEPPIGAVGAGRRRLIRRLAIPLIILVVVVGGVIFRDRLTGNASALAVGDCFDAPNGAARDEIGEINDVQHHPCPEQHQFETFAVLKHPAAKSETYPGSQALFSWAEANCTAVFETYVGIPFQQSALGAVSIVPDEARWKDGGRTVVCYLGKPDGSPVTGSLKGTKQ